MTMNFGRRRGMVAIRLWRRGIADACYQCRANEYVMRHSRLSNISCIFFYTMSLATLNEKYCSRFGIPCQYSELL